MNKLLLSLTLFISFTLGISAQTTIGAKLSPVEGAILDLKEHDADADNVTASKGFVLPRVQLQGKKTLAPLASDANQAAYEGMAVFNLADVAATDNIGSLKRGINVWDGTEWLLVGGNSTLKYFYAPPFTLPLGTVGDTKSFNIYNEYRRRFTSSFYDPSFPIDVTNPRYTTSASEGSSFVLPGLYGRYDLYYVILDYSDEIEVFAMDNAGNVNYRIKSSTASADSYVNIIMIVKK